MIGVDTNVLARLLVDDGAPERELALKFFGQRGSNEVTFVSLVVLVELVWLLGSRYNYPRPQIMAALETLLANAGFQLEEEDLVIAALDNARATNSGIADNLIAALGRQGGYVRTWTFDKFAAARIPGMELLA